MTFIQGGSADYGRPGRETVRRREFIVLMGACQAVRWHWHSNRVGPMMSSSDCCLVSSRSTLGAFIHRPLIDSNCFEAEIGSGTPQIV
jgi:hypothetical protein